VQNKEEVFFSSWRSTALAVYEVRELINFKIVRLKSEARECFKNITTTHQRSSLQSVA